jgi:hypothetical protein
MGAQLTNQVLSLTTEHYVKKMEDNVFSSKPFLWGLKQAGKINNYHGTTIEVPLMYAKVANRGSYSGTDVFATAAETGIGNASFDWKQYYALVSFTGIELAKNSGQQAVLSLLKARLEQAEMTVAEELDQMLLGDGTGNSNKDWDGLLKFVGTAAGTVGGIDASTNTWWQSNVNASAVADAGLIAAMRTRYNIASEGNDHPSNVLTTRAAFEVYEGQIQANQRFLDNKMADAGFENLMFKAAPITYDTYVAAGDMYFINLKYIDLAKLNDVWFKVSDFLQPTNQDVQFKHIKSYGNLVISNRKRQAALTSITNG